MHPVKELASRFDFGAPSTSCFWHDGRIERGESCGSVLVVQGVEVWHADVKGLFEGALPSLPRPLHRVEIDDVSLPDDRC